MALHRVTLTVNDEFLEMVEYAKGRWPGLKDNRSALVAQIVARWYNTSREGNGHEAVSDEHKEHHDLIESRIAALELENQTNRGTM